jgi:hypothetical protein
VIVINDPSNTNGLVGVEWLPPERLMLVLPALVIAGVLAWLLWRSPDQCNRRARRT